MENLLLSLSAECICFLQACLLGAVLGFFFDIFRILRRAFKCSNAVISAQDLLYCFVAGYATFCFLLRYCDGRLRWYVFIGEIIGWVLFRLTLGSLFVAAGTAILTAVVRVVKTLLNVLMRLFKLILSPFVVFWRATKIKVIFILKKCLDNVKKVYHNRKYRLKKRVRILYNHYKPHLRERLRPKRQRGRRRDKAQKA